MHSLEHTEEKFLSGFPTIDREKIGARIGAGAQHFVHIYGPTDILKFPRAAASQDVFSQIISPTATQTIGELRRDYDLCMGYFPGFTVPAHILPHTRSQTYCILQAHIAMRSLTLDDCRENSPIREEMEEILRGNAELRHRHHVWFDFMGWNPQKFLRVPLHR